MRLGTRKSSLELWTLLDPVLSNAAPRSLASDILTLANSDWTAPVTVDLSDPTVLRFLASHRATPMLTTSNVAESQRDELMDRLIQISGVQLRIEAVAKQALGILNDADVESRVLKGLASAELDYPSRVLRQGADVDLAVRPADFDRTVRLLTQAGYGGVGKPTESFLLKGTTLRSPSNVEVDLHTRLFQRSPLSDLLFISGEPLTDLPGSALPANMRLLHAAGHFILAPPGNRRLTGLVDIARMQCHAAVDLDVVRDYASQLGVEAMVGAALSLEAQLSGRAHVAEALSSWRQPDWLDRHTRLVPERRLTLDHLARFRSVLPEERLRYVATWLTPSQRYRRLYKQAVQRRVARFRSDFRAWHTMHDE